MKNFSQEYLKECFDYNEITGELLRRPRPRHHFKSQIAYAVSLARSGRVVSAKTKEGYLYVSLDGVKMYVHRVVWFIKTGECPLYIDHIDHDRTNNAWTNLRNVTPAISGKNLGLSSANKSGVTGVHFDKKSKKWAAQCSVNGKSTHIGHYSDIKEASNAVLKYRALHGYHKNHGIDAVKAHD